MVIPLAFLRRKIHRLIGSRRGFTLIEMLVVVVVIGIGTGLALPSMKDTFYKESVRNARRVGISMAARARGAAANRGCTAWLKASNGLGGRQWITTCDGTDAGTAIDTIGAVQFVNSAVSLIQWPDSIPFEATGISSSGVWPYMYYYRSPYPPNWVWITPLGGTRWN